MFSINETLVLGMFATRSDLNSSALSYNLILDTDEEKRNNIKISSIGETASIGFFNSISKTHPISQIYLNIVVNNNKTLIEKVNELEDMVNYYYYNIDILLFLEVLLGRYLVYRPIGYIPRDEIY